MRNPVQFDTRPIPVACFAAPLTDELLARYAALAEELPPARRDVRDAMRACLAAAKLWWDLPESAGHRDDPSLAILHRGEDVRVKLTSLTPDLVSKLDAAVPWAYELDAIQSLFDRVDPSEKELRDVCFHLLWFARELCHDREPLTHDRLPA